MTTIYHCKSCNQDCKEIELVVTCIFEGNQEEPSEFQLFCPCGANGNYVEERAVCRDCEDSHVPDEGDQCSECKTCEVDFLFDAMMEA